MDSTRPSLEEWEASGYLWLLANQTVDNSIADHNPTIAALLRKAVKDREASIAILAQRYATWVQDEQKRKAEEPIPAPVSCGVKVTPWQDRT